MTFLPLQGFPAHPHRGFETVTMTLKGGLRHRDSFGMKQEYGDGDVQWLTAGRGMLHEEMWTSDEGGNAELYQVRAVAEGMRLFVCMCRPVGGEGGGGEAWRRVPGATQVISEGLKGQPFLSQPSRSRTGPHGRWQQLGPHSMSGVGRTRLVAGGWKPSPEGGGGEVESHPPTHPSAPLPVVRFRSCGHFPGVP